MTETGAEVIPPNVCCVCCLRVRVEQCSDVDRESPVLRGENCATLFPPGLHLHLTTEGTFSVATGGRKDMPTQLWGFLQSVGRLCAYHS